MTTNKEVMTKKKAVLMCQTPLQALIAEKIIEKNADTQFFPVYTAYEWNHKHEHYATRLLTTCQCGIKREMPTIAHIAQLTTEIVAMDFSDIYFASIDAPLTLAVLTAKENVTVYTYDDGSANVTPKSFYFRKAKQPVAYPGLDIHWDKEKVKEASEKHYTIFNSTFNIVSTDKLVYVELFPVERTNSKTTHNKKVSVLIGQMVTKPEENSLLMYKVMTDYQIDYYFPHPRETVSPIVQEKTIHTDLIFEEYVATLLETYDEIELYHFYSTVALNLRRHPRITEKTIDKVLYESWYFTV